MRLLLTLLFWLYSIPSLCSTYKIVIFTPAIANSQINANKRVAEVLANAGHDVTLVNLNYIDGFENLVKVDSKVKVHNVNASTGLQENELKQIHAPLIFNEIPIWDYRQRKFIKTLMFMVTEGCRQTLRNKEFLRWLKKENFDIAFAHHCTLCHIGLVKAANIPSYIWLNTLEVVDWVANLVGVPIIPSYVPPIFIQSMDEMSFFERLKSFLAHIAVKRIWPLGIPAAETRIFREELDPNFPDLLELAAETPLIMAMSNSLYEMPRPTLAKLVNIGGLGMQFKDTKPLSGEFAKIADKAKGLIIFSFGTIVAAHEMPEDMKNAFLDAFREFPDYHFIMRYEIDDLNDRKPSNVHLFKWLPQSDLLAYRKTVAFITHGGYNSIQEALAVGVPLITLPLFADQGKVSMMTRKHGISVLLTKDRATKENIIAAIREIIDNQEYKLRAKRMSAMLRKQPIASEQLLVRWTEFVAEFKTLENLVPAGQKLNFVQYHSIDVLAFLLATTLMIVYIIYKISKFLIYHIIYRKIFSKKTKSE